MNKLPDGSGFFVASFPLPKDHWIFAPPCAEWDDDRDTSADTPHPILTHHHRDAVVTAIRYAVRGATMCGTDMYFDPDALQQSAVYALCGPFSMPKPSQVEEMKLADLPEEKFLQLAAQAWCSELTKNTPMDVQLCVEFARIIERQATVVKDGK